MPPKKCCKKCSNPENAYVCFKKGLGVGFKLGIDKTKYPPLEEMTIRRLAEVASEYKIKDYGKLNKAQLIEALENAGYRAGKAPPTHPLTTLAGMGLV